MPHAKRCKKPAARRATKTFVAGEKMRCYEAGLSIKAGIYNLIPVETALELVAERSAEWVDKKTAIRMFSRKLLQMRQSYIMTVAFMQGVVDGDPYCVRLWEMAQRGRAA